MIEQARYITATMIGPWAILMLSLGLGTVILGFQPRWAQRIMPYFAPVIIGFLGLILFFTTYWSALKEVQRSLWCGLVNAQTIHWIFPIPRGLTIIGSLLISIGFATMLFSIEKCLLRIPVSRFAPISVLRKGVKAPSRREGMAGVAMIANSPTAFMILSIWSAVGEELVFRGGMLTVIWKSQNDIVASIWQFWPFLIIQGLLFGLVHITFGLRTVVCKTVLGIGFSLTGLFAGIPIGAILPHIYYQVLVIRQFTRRPCAVPQS
jgi:membrane protease YdiL (CAAX protease family)